MWELILTFLDKKCHLQEDMRNCDQDHKESILSHQTPDPQSRIHSVIGIACWSIFK